MQTVSVRKSFHFFFSCDAHYNVRVFECFKIINIDSVSRFFILVSFFLWKNNFYLLYIDSFAIINSPQKKKCLS